jgi:hypothetical protein
MKDRLKSNRTKTTFAILLLTAGLILQVISAIGPARSDLVAIWKTIGQPGLWRSANFTGGLKFANYIRFLVEAIPEDARVVLPAETTGLWLLSNTPAMQFFLAPRQVVNCTGTDPQCAADLNNAGAYLLVTGDDGYPGKEVTQQPERLRMYNETWGLYLPEVAGSGTPLPQFSSLVEVARQAVLPAIWLALLTLGGYGLVHRWLPILPITSRVALGYGLGTGALSLLLSLASLLGAPISRLTILAITLGWAALGVGALLYHQLRSVIHQQDASPNGRRRVIDFWHVCLLLLWGVAVAISVGKGYHATDEVVLWGAKGYGIAGHGIAAGASQWGTRTMAYPLNIPLLIAAFKTIFNEILPASKVLFPLFYLGLLILVYDFLSLKSTRTIAGLATLVLATAPILFQHATIGYANLPLVFTLVAALVLFQYALAAGPGAAQNAALFFAGTFLALGAWTRPEGMLMSWIVVAIVVAWIIPVARKTGNLRSLAYLLAPLCLYTLFWLIASRQIYPPSDRNSGMYLAAITQISNGNLHPAEAGYILSRFFRDLVSHSVWGVIGIGLLLLPWLGSHPPAGRNNSWLLTMAAGLCCILLVLGIYLLVSYAPGRDISWWVSTGLDRMIMPGIVLLWLGIASRLGTEEPGV